MMQEDFNREIMQENYARVPGVDLFPVAWLNVPRVALSRSFSLNMRSMSMPKLGLQLSDS